MATITAGLYLSRLAFVMLFEVLVCLCSLCSSVVAFAHFLCGEIGLLRTRIYPCCIAFFLRLNVIFFFFFRFINLRISFGSTNFSMPSCLRNIEIMLSLTTFRINTLLYLHVIFRWYFKPGLNFSVLSEVLNSLLVNGGIPMFNILREDSQFF